MTAVDIPLQVGKITKAMGARFSLNGKPMTIEEVFSPPACCQRLLNVPINFVHCV